MTLLSDKAVEAARHAVEECPSRKPWIQGLAGLQAAEPIIREEEQARIEKQLLADGTVDRFGTEAREAAEKARSSASAPEFRESDEAEALEGAYAETVKGVLAAGSELEAPQVSRAAALQEFKEKLLGEEALRAAAEAVNGGRPASGAERAEVRSEFKAALATLDLPSEGEAEAPKPGPPLPPDIPGKPRYGGPAYPLSSQEES